MLKILFKLFKALNSEAEPHQISLAFCFSMIAGLTPFLSLHNLLVLLLVLLLRVNLSAFVVGLGVFSAIAYIIDPLFHRIGLFVLTASNLEGLWTSIYNSTLWRLENFNNSIVMGSLLFSLILFIPLFIIMNILIVKYRTNVMAWVEKTKIVQGLRAGKIYNLYKAASGWGGAS